MAAALAAAVLHTGIWCQVQSSLMQGTSCSLQYRWILWGWLQVSAGSVCSVWPGQTGRAWQVLESCCRQRLIAFQGLAMLLAHYSSVSCMS